MQATRFHSRSGLQKRLFWCSAQSSKSASSSASGLASKKRLSELVADSGGQDGTAKLNASGRPLAFLGATFGSGAAVHHRSAALVLEDGSRFTGMSFGYESFAEGELVFNTGMVGYPENLTDPSYKGQFLVSTYPIVGNYGVPDEAALDSIGLPEFMESDQVHVSAFIVQDYSHHHSHWNSRKSLSQWLTEQRVPALYGIDTRALTKRIRDRGAMLARIEFDQAYAPGGMPGSGGAGNMGGDPTVFTNPNLRNLIAEVSTPCIRVFGEGNPTKIVAVDTGIKYNMIRHLCARGCEVKLVPWNHKFSEETYDGLFLSNGPGDPSTVPEVVAELQRVIHGDSENAGKPIFGICMGNQMLGTAAGASTYKMPFGNRGQNVPVLNELTGRCMISPQNHGYAVDTSTLQEGWAPLFTNKNDGTNEGIYHKTKPWFSAQFHPEARGGPTETEDFFDLFVDMAASKGKQTSVASHFTLNKLPKPEVKKVLMLGSGGLSIGQAGEFDYSGSQAIKALKEEGLETILINPNIASVQTNLNGDNQADTVYFMPVTPAFVEEVIKKEKPDSIILSMGGQTGLNCGVELEQSGVLAKYNVQVLGTSVESIMNTEDRDLFSAKLNEINESMAPSEAVVTVEAALEAAEIIGYPCMIRSAYALGGLGSGICADREEMMDMASKALASSPQILVEKSMLGWKEVEYEVVRDVADNCITVCNMENFDPLGVHTGDSIVVAPSQTLSNDEYHMLRETALKTVRHMGIIGECNIQYALNPFSKEYCIIEINPRLSRSSALASKATGYPLAFVAAKLALGNELPDLKNSVTKSTTACFEPALDYIVCKVPRWDLSKFDKVSRKIGSAMKSVGEVMAVGRTFEESLQKALRMVDPSVNGFEPHGWTAEDEEHLNASLVQPSDTRINTISRALEDGMSVERLNELTAIDPWFLYKCERIAKVNTLLRQHDTLEALSPTTMLQAKKSGFSDIQIAARLGDGTKYTEDDVRAVRKSMNIKPFVKQIDTMAGEFPASTNYLYTTYNGDEHDVELGSLGGEDGGEMVLGSGAYRIGSSVEFDWCSVSAIRTLRELGRKTVVVNYNPETVSTDYDECDRLYFEELSKERILDIYEAENCEACTVSVGGQIPNTLALPLHEAGMNIRGTSPVMIDGAEDREKFSAMCDAAGIDQPAWQNLTSVEAAFDFADEVGYPVLVRPSYVLSGAAMNVAYTAGELARCLQEAEEVSDDKPVVITKFVEGGREIDVDAVADNGTVIAHAVSEHVENAGIHSGDACLMLPTQTIPDAELRLVRDTIGKVAKSLEITGPFNMQLIAKDGKVQIIETNLRASRTFPFSSKTCGADFIAMATRAMVGADQLPLPDGVEIALEGANERPLHPSGYVGVKVPMFSFKRLLGADPTLGVEMASTGEVACYGADKEEAFLKALMSTDASFAMPNRSVLVSMQDRLQEDFLPSARKLTEQGFSLYATEKTARYLESEGISVTEVAWPGSGALEKKDITEMIRQGEIDLVLMFANNFSERIEANYDIRRLAVDFGVPLLTNLQVAELFADAMEKAAKTADGDLVQYLQTKTLKEHYGDRKNIK